MFAGLFNLLAPRLERERLLAAGRYERTPARRGSANGYKAERIDTPAGTLTREGPETKGHEGHEGEPFQPVSLERGRRSRRAAVMLAVAGMYVTKGCPPATPPGSRPSSAPGRPLRGVTYVVGDDHAGLRGRRAPGRAAPGATRQRGQFHHLARNALPHAPTRAIRGRIGAELRRIWNAARDAR